MNLFYHSVAKRPGEKNPPLSPSPVTGNTVNYKLFLIKKSKRMYGFAFFSAFFVAILSFYIVKGFVPNFFSSFWSKKVRKLFILSYLSRISFEIVHNKGKLSSPSFVGICHVDLR